MSETTNARTQTYWIDKNIDGKGTHVYTHTHIHIEKDKKTRRRCRDVIICVRIVRLASMVESFDISRSLIKLERIIAPRGEGEPRSNVVVSDATERGVAF